MRTRRVQDSGFGGLGFREGLFEGDALSLDAKVLTHRLCHTHSDAYNKTHTIIYIKTHTYKKTHTIIYNKTHTYKKDS
jgi:hypothetical protein